MAKEPIAFFLVENDAPVEALKKSYQSLTSLPLIIVCHNEGFYNI